MQALGQRPDTRDLLQMVRKVKIPFISFFYFINFGMITCRAVSEDQTYDTIEFNEAGEELNLYIVLLIMSPSFCK